LMIVQRWKYLWLRGVGLEVKVNVVSTLFCIKIGIKEQKLVREIKRGKT